MAYCVYEKLNVCTVKWTFIFSKKVLFFLEALVNTFSFVTQNYQYLLLRDNYNTVKHD
jgi:hypothetical protein